jgi:hypothetical protein
LPGTGIEVDRRNFDFFWGLKVAYLQKLAIRPKNAQGIIDGELGDLVPDRLVVRKEVYSAIAI